MKTSISIFLLLLLLFTTLPASADHHNEEDRPAEHSEFTPAFRIASITKYRDWDFQLSLSGEFRNESADFYELQTVLYYRVFKHLKVGVLYSLQKGERHDDDWITEGDGWFWKDSSDRYENLIGADITPRALLPFLPGRNWLISAKSRYSYNLNNEQQKILFRPELSYFHMKNRRLRWSVSSAYALYFPINFSDAVLYEHGPYLSFTMNINKNLLLGLSGDYLMRNWSSSEAYKNAGGEYLIQDQRYRLAASLIWKIDIRDKKR